MSCALQFAGLARAVWLFTFVGCLSMAGSSSADEKPRYYSIRMNDQLIGFAAIRRETVERDGEPRLRLQSETSLKLSLLGTERTTRLVSETWLQPVTHRPLGYRLTETTNAVVRHVEAEFAGGAARTWVDREGDPRGEPLETELPTGAVILGSNNFAHWQLLLQAAGERAVEGVAKIPVFLPDTAQVEPFELRRGGLADVRLAGEIRNCVSWRLARANLNALADARSGELVRLILPAQQTTIELTDAGIEERFRKSRAEEVLARHFTQANVVFDDFLKVERLQAEIDVNVIGSGVAHDASVLTTVMQQFDGEKKGDHIAGTVTIRSIAYQARNGPAFPAPAGTSELNGWLKPSAQIESDHASIKAQSAELTKGAKTRWEAVLRIGRWVHEEIAYAIADSPSARLALEKRQGDCGPQATLMVALLRAAGIPARLVGGLVYSPTFGGSFGQHAWVEVHMGPAGWLPMDPTTGEFERLSATHIKLFEGLGGVIPQSVRVTAFEPPNRDTAPVDPAQVKPLPWKLDHQYTFKYMQGDRELGTETFTIARVERDGIDVFEMNSEVQLKLNLLSSLNSQTKLVVAADARPLALTRELSLPLKKVKIQCTFEGGVVKEQISGSQNLTREIKLPAGTYCFDNNLMGCWALLCCQLPLEADKPVSINTFHPSSMQIIPLTFTARAPAPIRIGGSEVECFECDVAPIRNTFWISRNGRFVRARQGELVIELTKIE